MKFLAEWIENAPNASLQERSTLCDLQIFLGNGNACAWEDLDTGESFHHLTLPAVHLAEGISSDWWSIFGSRDRPQSIRRHRTGYALPDLRFNFDGVTVEVTAKKFTYQNPRLTFTQDPTEAISRQDAEQELSELVWKVIQRLEEFGIQDAEVSACWSRVLQSMGDPEEAAFCEAAGALGVDPYSIEETDASFIEAAGELFSGEELIEFLADFRAGRETNTSREMVLEGIRRAEAELPETSRLPYLYDAANQVGHASQRRRDERVWAASYRAARALREAMGIGAEVKHQTPATVAAKLGSSDFRNVEYLPGVDAVVSCVDKDAHVYLGKPGGRASENFAFARAVGSAICFPETRLSVVNKLQGAERQAAGRAFAAEFLAPIESVTDMRGDGLEINDISREFNVSPTVIELQIENRNRIRSACSVDSFPT